jgi:ATP-dependent RNA helicase DDX21
MLLPRYDRNNDVPFTHLFFFLDSTQDFTDPNFLRTTNPRWIQAGLDSRVLDVLNSRGITHFTKVQGEAFDPVVAGRDVIGRSRTGTGKTLAFGLPSIARLNQLLASRREANGRLPRGRLPGMLVLCPTRELARQVKDELAAVAEPLGLFVDVFHGGVSYDPQSRALSQGLDIVVGTPGRVMDHLDRGTLSLDELQIVVLDEADEMLNMGFAEDVEVILEGAGKSNNEKTQCLLFSATTPKWVNEIGRRYQRNVLEIDATGNQDARVASTVRHLAVQVPPGVSAKKAILEDIIAVEISKDAGGMSESASDESENEFHNPVAAAAKKAKKQHLQQKIFGKTIVFCETKKMADDLVSGGVFKSLTAQALHGDVSQKQRDATLNAFRAGAFNVLVATDVAARGIDIQDVDLVVQMDPPRDVDTYVHRSGRTGRAGNKGVSVLMFNPQQSRDIVRIERDLGHNFRFQLTGPPSIEAALNAAAKTSALACQGIPEEVSTHFEESAAALLADEDEDPVKVVARCLAAISRRATQVESRSLLTGEVGMVTVQMMNERRSVSPNDVLFTVSKLARLSRESADLTFETDIGKILARDDKTAIFDMSLEDAKKLVEFSKEVDAGGNSFSILKEMEVERGNNFGRVYSSPGRGGGGGGGGRFARSSASSRGPYNAGRGGSAGRPRGRGDFPSSGRDFKPKPRGRDGAYTISRDGGGRGGSSSSSSSRDGGRNSSFRGRYDSQRGNDGW